MVRESLHQRSLGGLHELLCVKYLMRGKCYINHSNGYFLELISIWPLECLVVHSLLDAGGPPEPTSSPGRREVDSKDCEF